MTLSPNTVFKNTCLNAIIGRNVVFAKSYLYYSENCLMVGPGGLSAGFSVVATHHEVHA